jgi:hypothetical protein
VEEVPTGAVQFPEAEGYAHPKWWRSLRIKEQSAEDNGDKGATRRAMQLTLGTHQ